MQYNEHLIEWLKREIKSYEPLRLNHAHSGIYIAILQECRAASLIELDSVDYDKTQVIYRLTAIGAIALGIQQPADSASEDTPSAASEDSEAITPLQAYLDKEAFYDSLNPLNATPQPAAPQTGEYKVVASGYGVIKEVQNPIGENLYSTSNGELADEIADILNTETASLRSQFAQLHAHGEQITLQWSETLDTLHAELQTARERVAALEAECEQRVQSLISQGQRKNCEISNLTAVIQQAYDKLMKYNGDSFSLRVIAARELLEPYTRPQEDRD